MYGNNLDMNWYRTLIASNEVQQISQIVEQGIWLPLVNSKKQLSQQMGDFNLQHTFMQCENAARRIADSCNNNDFNNAQRLLQTFNTLLGKICGHIQCDKIKQSAQQVGSLLQRMVGQAAQPVQQQGVPAGGMMNA